jgi:L-alanine-DL-glutamate epimerase-like enolase superfamily enzyme
MQRIDKLSFGYVNSETPGKELRWGTHHFRHAALLAKVRSEDGEVGLGVAWAHLGAELSLARAAQSALAGIVVGSDALLPFETGSNAQDAAYNAGVARAGSVVEMALWDLTGRILDVPAYQLLGRKRRSLPAYIISAEEFAFTSVTQFVALARRYVNAGFRACKFHLWGEAERDIAACRAIRKEVGDEVALMLDPASRYGRVDALRVGRVIDELGFVRYEDPISPRDIAGYHWLSERMSVPLVANETLRWSIHDCKAAAQSGIVQGFRLEIGRAGIAHGLALGAVAEATGAELDIASLAPRGGIELCLHFGLASAATRWFEHHEVLGIEEIPGIAAGISIVDGVAIPNDGAGFGCAIDWHELDRHCTWVECDPSATGRVGRKTGHTAS